MSNFEHKLNSLASRIRNLENRFSQFFYNNDSNRNQQQRLIQSRQATYNNNQIQVYQPQRQQPPVYQEETRSSDINVNVLGFYNMFMVESSEIVVEDEKSTTISWKEPSINNGKAFSGVYDENILINLTGKNVLYEFIITVSWKPDVNGFRTVSLEDSTGKIISSTLIPDDIDIDINHTHKHQVIFKQEATKKGGWKIKLFQNSGDILNASVNVKIIGPFIF
jgi:hypothetical protein